MGKKTAAKPKSRHAKTQEQLAKAIGVSRRMVGKLGDRDDWPFGKKGPFDVPAVAAWRVRHQQIDTAGVKADHLAYAAAMRAIGMEPVTEQQVKAKGSLTERHMLAKIRKLDREHEVATGKLIDRDLSERLYVGMVQWIKERINQWVETMPVTFVGADEDRIRKLARESWDRICMDAYNKTSMELASVDEVQRVKALTDENKARARINTACRFRRRDCEARTRASTPTATRQRTC